MVRQIIAYRQHTSADRTEETTLRGFRKVVECCSDMHIYHGAGRYGGPKELPQFWKFCPFCGKPLKERL